MSAQRNKKSVGSVEKAPVVVRNAQRKVPLKAKALAAFACRAWQACDRMSGKQPWPVRDISIVFVSDRTIGDVHDRFMGVSGPTDVITFQHGEIVISAETARRQARQYRSSLMRELQLYIIHGLLHLRGYSDKTSAGSREMGRRQQSILRRLVS